ncbi:MAG TPA: OsmC family protein [Alphaproteobacteria bacterium]|nr:OsmC family protein [Alphaproteobacteria bacterium]
MIQAKVKLTFPTALQFVVETGRGHRLIIDDPVGQTGPKPIELMAAALAGCTAFDVATILRNKKQKKLKAYEVSVDAEQRKLPPQVFTDVKIHHSITGDDIDAESVEEAIRLSEEKYCSVGAMVRESGATITTTYSIQSDQDVAVGTVENHAGLKLAAV